MPYSEVFDRSERHVLLPEEIQAKVHDYAVKYDISCNAVCGLILERYFRIPFKEREKLERALYDAFSVSKRYGGIYKFSLDIKLTAGLNPLRYEILLRAARPKKTQTKKPKTAKTAKEA